MTAVEPGTSSLPRPEYPRPQWRRERWLNLNGAWSFEIDAGDSGFERGLVGRDLEGTIVVPFAPESPLSGVENTDFMPAVWYRRDVVVPADWTARILLHFGAVDYDTTVWVDGIEVGRHRGGFTSFSVELPDGPSGRTVTIVIRARDGRDTVQARGKQSTRYENFGCEYTRTTGIWQTVWLEPVPEVHLRRPRITPSLGDHSFDIVAPVSRNVAGSRIRVSLMDDGAIVAETEARSDLDLSARLRLTIPEGHVRAWYPQDPHLYTLEFALLDARGTVLDRVESYAGLRSIAIDGKRILINGEPVFQRLVLDQGYYPHGIMTAPSDDALVHDIELGMAAGFNGARLHQKVFEERYLYHADRLGYLVWGEFGDWVNQPDWRHPALTASFITEWCEAIERDYNHPAIIGWCPLNETWEPLDDRMHDLDDVTRGMFLATKLADTSRPVLDTSGHSHRVLETDVYDSHNYYQDPEQFAALMAPLADDRPFTNVGEENAAISVPYRGQPYFCSEFGGIWWDPSEARAAAQNDSSQSWGYGDRPTSEEEFHHRFEGLVGVLLNDPNMFGYCYTQLTDVFQERNGVYAFDRSPKLDVARVAAVQSRRAAIEGSAAPFASSPTTTQEYSHVD